MAEYIMEESGLRGHIDQYWVDAAAREMVVRCRDCKHSLYRGSICRHPELGGGFEGDPYLDVGPDGFCAWGEPRE